MDNEVPKGIILTLNRIIFDLDEIGNVEIADLMRKFMQILLKTFKIEFQINRDDSHSYSFKHKIRLFFYLCFNRYHLYLISFGKVQNPPIPIP